MPDRPSSERWTIQNVATGEGGWYAGQGQTVCGPLTDWIEVVPRELLDRLIEAGEKLARFAARNPDGRGDLTAADLLAWDAAVREAQG